MNEIKVVVHPAADIYTNMAVDEALFRTVKKNTSVTLLRIYRNKNHSVTLGYFQSAECLDVEFLKKNSIEYVRRITGGRAVLHGDDLIFSIVGTIDSSIFHSSISRTTKNVAKVIKKAFANLGVDVDASVRTTIKKGDTIQNFHCFNSLTKNEILIGNKKIVGFALKKRAETFLLQGSIMLDLDRRLYSNIIKGSVGADISDTVTCLNDCAVEGVLADDLTDALLTAFAAEGMTPRSGDLSSDEWSLAEELRKKKYMDSTWNNNPKKYTEEGINV